MTPDWIPPPPPLTPAERAVAWRDDFAREHGRPPTDDEALAHAARVFDEHPEALAYARRLRDLNFPDGGGP